MSPNLLNMLKLASKLMPYMRLTVCPFSISEQIFDILANLYLEKHKTENVPPPPATYTGVVEEEYAHDDPENLEGPDEAVTEAERGR